MAKEYISLRNLKFMLHEVFDLKKVNSLPKYQDYDAEAYDMALAAAKDIADTYLFPIFREMDKNKAYYDEESGEVKVHPELQKAIKALADGGWIGAYASYEAGAQKAIDKGVEGDENLFYQGKIHAMKYYFEYEVPKIQALRDRLMSPDNLTVEMESGFLN